MRKTFNLFSYFVVAILIIVVASALFTSCTTNTTDDISMPGKPISHYGRYQIVTVRSCEYVENSYDYSTPLIHAGDCSNPIHQNHDTIQHD